jgi:hypothetical protein
VTVGSISKEPEGLASFKVQDEYDVDDMEAVAGALLGCPATIDHEEKTIEFNESPELHRGVSNAILDFAENNTALLNDFKHGFRVLPTTPDNLEFLIDSSAILSEDDMDSLKAKLSDLRDRLQDDDWGFCFARMDTDSTDHGHEVELDVYYVDARSCYKFAELTLDALQNLITPGGIYLEDTLAEIPALVLDGEVSVIDHVFGLSTPLQEEPETVTPAPEEDSN